MSMIVNGRDLAFLLYETLFLDAKEHVIVAWMQLEQGVAALVRQNQGKLQDKNFYPVKLYAMAFFYRYELPKIKAKLDLVTGLDSTCYSLSAEQFIGH